MPGKLWFMKINILSSTSIAQITVVQFATEHRDTFDCLTSAQALSAKIVTVTEVGQGGSVNHLLVRNTSPHFVFFTDGDILIGARQNRVLNVSLLLAPHSETVVPVSCVEQGRWHPMSKELARPSVGVGTERRCSTPDRTTFDLEYEGFSIHRSILARS